MKSIIKEVICMALIAVAMVIILILVFYDYLNINTGENETIEYSRDDEVSNALEDDAIQSNQIIVSLSKSMYSLDSDDVSDYIAEGIIDRGKKHPFSDIESNTYDGVNTVNTGSASSSSTSSSSSSTTSTSGSLSDKDYNSGSSNSSSTTNNSNKNDNKDTSSTNQKEDKDDKDNKKEDDDKPFFDTGTTK